MDDLDILYIYIYIQLIGFINQLTTAGPHLVRNQFFQTGDVYWKKPL